MKIELNRGRMSHGKPGQSRKFITKLKVDDVVFKLIGAT